MIPKANVSTASAIATQTVATSCTSGSTHVMGITNVSATGVSPNTGLVEISITTGREYLPHAFGNKICFPQIERGDVWSEFCSLTANGNHKHEVTVKREYQLADAKPIPAGAVRLFESSVYVDSAEPLAQGYCLIEQTSTVFIEKNEPQCLTCLDEEDQTQVTCSVAADLHIHTKKKQISIPQSENPIPEGALSFYQDYNYISSEEKHFAASLIFDSNDPPNEPGYSHRLVANRLSKEGTSFHDWRIPHGWDPLPRSVREKYLNDIVSCYQKGASSKALSLRHNIDSRGINGLLLLRISRKDMLRAHIQKKLSSENKEDVSSSPFADACEFEKTLGTLLKGRARNRKYSSLQMQKKAAPKANLECDVASNEAISSLAGISSQDANLPPKKRLSFRAFLKDS